jgi:preprotein translocase subunit YajC
MITKVIIIASILILIYLIMQRAEAKKDENFEKRDN